LWQYDLKSWSDIVNMNAHRFSEPSRERMKQIGDVEPLYALHWEQKHNDVKGEIMVCNGSAKRVKRIFNWLVNCGKGIKHT
jgi:hypothetical protein